MQVNYQQFIKYIIFSQSSSISVLVVLIFSKNNVMIVPFFDSVFSSDTIGRLAY